MRAQITLGKIADCYEAVLKSEQVHLQGGGPYPFEAVRHGDFTCDNIVQTPNGELVLIDFTEAESSTALHDVFWAAFEAFSDFDIRVFGFEEAFVLGPERTACYQATCEAYLDALNLPAQQVAPVALALQMSRVDAFIEAPHCGPEIIEAVLTNIEAVEAWMSERYLGRPSMVRPAVQSLEG